MTNESRLVPLSALRIITTLATDERWPERFPKCWDLVQSAIAATPTTQPEAVKALRGKYRDQLNPTDQAEWQPIETAPMDGTEVEAVSTGSLGVRLYPVASRFLEGKWCAWFGPQLEWGPYDPQPDAWRPKQTPPTPEAERLAVEIADEAAWEIIMSESGWETIDGVQWRDCSPVEGEPSLEKEIRYLGMRGLIIHHPYRPELVRVGEKS